MEKEALPLVVADVVAAKCGEIRSLSVAWCGVGKKALAAGHDPQSVAELMGLMASPTHFEKLISILAKEERRLVTFLKALRGLVDESGFDLVGWVAGIEEIQAELIRAGRTSELDTILGYVRCAAEFGDSAAIKDSLPEIVRGMLKEYGFEGQEGCLSS